MQNLAKRARKRADAIHRAEEYHLEVECLKPKLKKAKEDATEQIRQKD